MRWVEITVEKAEITDQDQKGARLTSPQLLEALSHEFTSEFAHKVSQPELLI